MGGKIRREREGEGSKGVVEREEAGERKQGRESRARKTEIDGESDGGQDERKVGERERERWIDRDNETDGERETWCKWQSLSCQSPSAFRRPKGQEDVGPVETSTNNKTASLTIFRNIHFVCG